MLSSGVLLLVWISSFEEWKKVKEKVTCTYIAFGIRLTPPAAG